MSEVSLYYNYTENKKNITDEHAKKGVLVGYDDVSRTYKVYSLSTRRVVRTSEAEFIEDKFPLCAPETRTVARENDEQDDDELQWGQAPGEQPRRLDRRVNSE